MTDRDRAKAETPVLARVEEPGTLRRANPLVKICRIVRGIEIAKIERKHSRSVGSVDEDVNVACSHLVDDSLDGEDERRLTRDVIDDDQTRAARDFLQDSLDDHVG